MAYRASKADKDLLKFFNVDMSCAFLKSIRLLYGKMRGIDTLDIEFKFPITAIAGKNGVGKSTILALACCAFHNNGKGYKNPRRSNSYYTFSDFFVQHKDESSPQGVAIQYGIAHHNWKKSEKIPSGVGLGHQVRKKKNGGKWNDYATRVNRGVVFLGIERIVPHVERSQSRSYSKVFKEGKEKGWEDKVKDAVGYVLGRDYSKFRYHEYSKYSLPVVMVGDIFYSGLNMGAGENALFEIFSSIYSCGRGGLLVMDEIELGLHAEAQTRFIKKLKEICLEMRSQVICTTHSREIFNCLPPLARLFIEDVNGKTTVTPCISSEYAFAKLSGIVGNEMSVYVEDRVAKAILDSALPSEVRRRVDVKVIGSSSCIARQLAANFCCDRHSNVLAVFDGDQQKKEKSNSDVAVRSLDTPNDDFSEWFSARCAYLPGEGWPELWLFENSIRYAEKIAPVFRMNADELVDFLKESIRAGKHNELYTFSKLVGREDGTCLDLLANAVCDQESADFEVLVAAIAEALDEGDGF